MKPLVDLTKFRGFDKSFVVVIVLERAHTFRGKKSKFFPLENLVRSDKLDSILPIEKNDGHGSSFRRRRQDEINK
jgi:hypothetical protein